MLTMKLTSEFYDEDKQEFLDVEDLSVDLEHSLVSLSKWESKWGKPFMTKEEKTQEETLSYIEMMCVGEIPEKFLSRLSNEQLKEITDYIEKSQTATWFNDTQNPSRPNNEVMTAELVYYWMTNFQVPLQAENWHLSRLFALLRICGIKNSPPKKMSKSEIRQRNRELNAQRKAEMGTRG